MSIQEAKYRIKQAWDLYDMGVINREQLITQLDGYLTWLENEGAIKDAQELRRRYDAPKRD